MARLAAVLAFALGLAGCGSSPFTQAPAAQVTPSSSPYAIPGVPQSQYECVTDEGYGRSMPCSAKD